MAAAFEDKNMSSVLAEKREVTRNHERLEHGRVGRPSLATSRTVLAAHGLEHETRFFGEISMVTEVG